MNPLASTIRDRNHVTVYLLISPSLHTLLVSVPYPLFTLPFSLPPPAAPNLFSLLSLVFVPSAASLPSDSTSPGLMSRRDASALPPLATLAPSYAENINTTTTTATTTGSSTNCSSRICRKPQRQPSLPSCFHISGSSSSGNSSSNSSKPFAKVAFKALVGGGALALVLFAAWLTCLSVSEFYIQTYCLQVRRGNLDGVKKGGYRWRCALSLLLSS